jgi:hypothetical protein
VNLLLLSVVIRCAWPGELSEILTFGPTRLMGDWFESQFDPDAA